MLERVVGESIEFSTTLAEDLGTISADNGQIEQIIMNLVVNARDAMPDGGRLLLATGNVTLEGVSTEGRPDTTRGDHVVLTVTDTGEGMDAATVVRIFEPYYTTKERGAGTGLGLATVDGIVKQSGCHIDVESEPGVGTTIRIYTVLLAPNGAAGLELAQNHPDPIQLLMTDILMPKMGGIELAERLAALRPELKVLYTSGYADGGGGSKRVAGAGYLEKPYAMEELARTVRELLDPGRPAVSGVPGEPA
jgi:CheY-like chemotaxis protein